MKLVYVVIFSLFGFLTNNMIFSQARLPVPMKSSSKLSVPSVLPKPTIPRVPVIQNSNKSVKVDQILKNQNNTISSVSSNPATLQPRDSIQSKDSVLSNLNSTGSLSTSSTLSIFNNNPMLGKMLELFEVTPKSSMEEKSQLAALTREAMEWDATCPECRLGFENVQKRAVELAIESKGELTARESFELALKEKGILEDFKRFCK